MSNNHGTGAMKFNHIELQEFNPCHPKMGWTTLGCFPTEEIAICELNYYRMAEGRRAGERTYRVWAPDIIREDGGRVVMEAAPIEAIDVSGYLTRRRRMGFSPT